MKFRFFTSFPWVFAMCKIMKTEIVIYLAILGSLYFMPEKIWFTATVGLRDSFWGLYKNNKLKNLSLSRTTSMGELLREGLLEVETILTQGKHDFGFFKEIKNYKFFTPLVLELLELHKKLGIQIKAILPKIRHALSKDIEFEHKLFSQLVGANLQFIVIIFVTWSFIFLSSMMVEIPIRLDIAFYIFLLEFFGIFSFNFIIYKYKNYVFSKYDSLIESLYLFVVMCEVGLSCQDTIRRSGLITDKICKHKSFWTIAKRIDYLVNRWQKSGIGPKGEAMELLEEIWAQKEHFFIKFLKTQEAIKFIILAFFFLPAYFLYLYSIFQFFMEQ